MINIIAALQKKDRGLGYQGDLLYRLPDDMKRLRELTTNQVIIMGRKTWESIPEKFRPLPNRENIVITRQTDYQASGAIVIGSLDEALVHATSFFPNKEIFIFGGAELYNQALAMTEKLYLTVIDGNKPADVFFPEYENKFKIMHTEEKTDALTGLSYSFVELIK